MNAADSAMAVTLGPIPFYWDQGEVVRFYEQVAKLPVAAVSLGEAVCAKRRQLRLDDWLKIAKDLQAAGKRVALATLGLLEAESERHAQRTLCEAALDAGLLIEANDYAAVQVASELGSPFVGGAGLNLYNARSVRLLQGLGMIGWVPPVELSREQLQSLMEALPADAPAPELLVHGHMALAISARCYTARAHDLPKDRCQFICQMHPRGIPVYSREGDVLFTLNGVQTLSGKCLNLLNHWQEARELGIRHLRLAAEGDHTLQALRALHAAIQGEQALVQPVDAEDCNGYWNRIAGLSLVD